MSRYSTDTSAEPGAGDQRHGRWRAGIQIGLLGLIGITLTGCETPSVGLRDTIVLPGKATIAPPPPPPLWQPTSTPVAATPRTATPTMTLSSRRILPPPSPPPFRIPVDWKIPRGVKQRLWKYIVLHHSASSGGSVESIHRGHLKRGWRGIGYHFVIGNGSGMPDGQIRSTFRWKQQMWGAHAGQQDYNNHGIGIALIGNFETRAPSPAQVESARQLVTWLRQEFNISRSAVRGHRDVRATACPGRRFPMSAIVGPR